MGIFRDNDPIGRNYCALDSLSLCFSSCGRGTYIINMNDVTRDDLIRINLDQLSISNHVGLERQSLLEAVDDVASMILLGESDTGVEHKKAGDDAEINPVLQTSSQKCGNLFLHEGQSLPVGTTAFVG